MLISNQNHLLAQGTLVTLVSGAHVGHNQPSRKKEREGGVLFYAGLLKCPAILMSDYEALFFSLCNISIFNALICTFCVLFFNKDVASFFYMQCVVGSTGLQRKNIS